MSRDAWMAVLCGHTTAAHNIPKATAKVAISQKSRKKYTYKMKLFYFFY